MKLGISSSAILLLLPVITAALADPTSNNENIKEYAAVERVPSGSNVVVPDLDELNPKASPKGTQDAPVDGRDGKPHAGPWVETNAERDRKKAGTVPSVEEQSRRDTKSADHRDSDGHPIPYSNDGVMDDRNRVAPKEGTRGTENGMSGKPNGNAYTTDKSPDSPKEAPPLPHSEEQKLPTTGDDSGTKDTKGSGTDSTLGVLEVLFPVRAQNDLKTNCFRFYRNPQIYRINRTIFRFPNHLLLAKIVRSASIKKALRRALVMDFQRERATHSIHSSSLLP